MFAPDWIDHHARTSPGSLACLDLHSGRAYTYAEFDHRIAGLSDALATTLGVSAGDRVLVLSRNDSDVFEIQFACQRRAAIFVPLNWRLALGELQAIAGDAGATVLFHGAEFAEIASQLAVRTPISRSVEMRCGRPSAYESLLARQTARRCAAARHQDETWALLYTSGTTGQPKGTQITYRMALCNAVVLGSAFRVTADSRNLVVLPTFHTGGLNVFANPVFFHGGANLVAREFDPGLILRVLSDAGHGVTHMLGVPTIHASLLAEPGFERIASAALQGLCVAGAPCPIATIERYAALGLALRQCWGMTEVGPLALITPHAASPEKRGSSGLPSLFARIRLADVEGGEVPDGQVGELLVNGPVVTPGYWNRPDANAAAFDNTGWFHTGDAAYRDADGYFFIVDRWKDMFISGGENVYPAELERALGLVPDVAECAVVAMPDTKWGEVGRAFVVRRQGSAITVEALRSHCEQHLARYKIPKEFVFVDALPRNAAGKVLKGQLHDVR